MIPLHLHCSTFYCHWYSPWVMLWTFHVHQKHINPRTHFDNQNIELTCIWEIKTIDMNLIQVNIQMSEVSTRSIHYFFVNAETRQSWWRFRDHKHLHHEPSSTCLAYSGRLRSHRVIRLPFINLFSWFDTVKNIFLAQNALLIIAKVIMASCLIIRMSLYV